MAQLLLACLLMISGAYLVSGKIVSHTWQPMSGGRVCPGAVASGPDKDGTTTYVARALHNGDVIPGKVAPSKSTAYVAYGGAEHGKANYEVLCGFTGVWMDASNGDVPADALVAGKTRSGHDLYSCQFRFDGIMTPGKLQPSERTCFTPFCSLERGSTQYQVLVDKS